MHRKSTFLLSLFLLLSLLIAPVGGAAALATEHSVAGADSLLAPAPNLIQDPSLELSYGSLLYWPGQASSNADSPLCRTTNPDCVSAASGPRTGTRWAMFGILDWEDEETINPEVGSLSQTVTFPSCGATLEFYLRIGQAPAGSAADDVFNVKIDNTTVFTTNATNQATYALYTSVTLDVSEYADGLSHTIRFNSTTTDQAVIFNLDDISLTRTCVTISGNAGVAAATVDYAGTTSGTTTANGSGAYSLSLPYDWSGRVTPSKTAYSFSPVSRTYANLATDMAAQNFTATLITYTISGNVDVPGVTLSYTDGTAKTATSNSNGDYAFSVSYNWSGTVIPTHPCFSFNPIDQSYTNVLSNQMAQDYTATAIPAAGCTDINVSIAGNNVGTFSIAEQGTLTQAPIPGVNNGPVKIESTTSIIGGERIIYKVNGVNTSFSEMLGLPASQLDTIYWLPWYNSKDLDTQLRIANVTENPATVTVTIGGVEMAPLNLTAGQSTRVSYPGVNAGPVMIESDQDIVAAERIIYKANGVNTSFSEMMALPAGHLDNTYWLPWYNNKDLDTQLRIANVTENPATVTVTIGGIAMPPLNIPAGQSTRVSYPGINNGPVQIVSDQDIVAAARVIYKVNGVNTSFSEMMALPNLRLASIYWFPRYNNKDLDTQLRLANVSDSQTATVHAYIGGQEILGSPFTIDPGVSIRKSFPGLNGGLVKVESDIPIVVAQRVIYKINNVNTSFSEMMGLPNDLLDTIYWLPWYNNKDLDSHLRFGLP